MATWPSSFQWGHRPVPLARLTSEGQENFVEPGRTQGEVVQADRALLQQGQRSLELLRTALDCHADPSGRLVDLGLTSAEAGERVRGLAQVPLMANVDLKHVATGALLQLDGGALSDGPPVIDNHDLISEVIRLVQVLRGQQDVGTLVNQPADRVPKVEAASRIEARGRLVQEQQAGRADKAGRQVQLALHASGISPGQSVTVLTEAHLFEDAGAVGASRRTILPEEAGDHLQVLASSHRWFDRSELPGQSDCLPHGVRLSDDIVCEDQQSSLVGLDQGGHASDEHGLAGAVGAQHGQYHPLLRDEVQAVESDRLSVVPDDSGGFDHRGHPLLLGSTHLSPLRRISSAVCDRKDRGLPTFVPKENPALFSTRSHFGVTGGGFPVLIAMKGREQDLKEWLGRVRGFWNT
jgi:hypothetical protein